jgi:hypothetical protein
MSGDGKGGKNMRRSIAHSGARVFGCSLLVLLTATHARAQSGAVVPDRFTATTAAMTPRDVTLRIDVREWSDEESRAAVVAALASESGALEALNGLPTLGYVWQSDSAVGHAVKYAHREPAGQGERITFVTDKRLGAYDIRPWRADSAASQVELEYSVIELYLDAGGLGTGSLSLAAAVELDDAGGLVSLAADAPRVLANAKAEPKPYWLTDADERNGKEKAGDD